jgi:nucleoside phosphorylase
MKKVLTLAAFEPELLPLREALASSSVSLSCNVSLHSVGIGLSAAAAGAALRAAAERPALVVLVGTCGVYEAAGVAAGDVVVANRVELVEPCAIGALGGWTEIPQPVRLVYEASAEAAAAFEKAGAKLVGVATTLGVTVDDHVATEIARTTGASAEHMEAHGVAAACAALGVPFVAVLGVANTVGSRARDEWKANHLRASRAVAPLLLRGLAELSWPLDPRQPGE